ncbi:MAG: Holliday junction branch migration protein RuvA [Chloroflexota bacterium]|nr:MAG: Holliday junction branch migration protein RuvA [Chloroflexota bacterium]
MGRELRTARGPGRGRARGAGHGPGGGRADGPRRIVVRAGRPRGARPRPQGREPLVIASVEGIVGAVAFDSLVIEVGGIGYRVFASPSVLATATPGGRLKLHTYHLVREDQQALYGFRTVEELGFFNLLLTVTGVGPKVALAIVGSRATAELQLAILQQDQAMLVAIPGIGRKLAERVIFELKEKVAAAGVAAASTVVAGVPSGDGDVVAALQALGYSLGEAREAARIAIAGSKVGDSLEDRVKTALRALARD